MPEAIPSLMASSMLPPRLNVSTTPPRKASPEPMALTARTRGATPRKALVRGGDSPFAAAGDDNGLDSPSLLDGGRERRFLVVEVDAEHAFKLPTVALDDLGVRFGARSERLAVGVENGVGAELQRLRG